MANKWVASPNVEQVADTPFELSDGLSIESGVLKANGTDGGFTDEFDGVALNPTNWPYDSGNLTVANGKVTFPIGGVTGWTERYMAHKVNSYTDFFGNEFIVHIDNAPSGTIVAFEALLSGGNTNRFFVLGDKLRFDNVGTVVKQVTLTPATQPMKLKFSIDGSGLCSFYAMINGSNEYELFGQAPILNNYVYLDIFQFYTSTTLADTLIVDKVEYYGYAKEATATLPESEAYSVQAPAKLASLDSVLVNPVTLGNGGEARLYMQYKDDEYPEWKSFEGVVGEWSDIGLIDGTTLPVTTCKPLTNGMVRCKIVFTGTGLVSYPEIDKITYTWSSDVTAPSEPVITTAIATNESILTMLFDALPADAYAIIYEVNINGAGSLPFSERGKIESGHGYMRFVGSKTEVQKEAEINSLLHSINGLRDGDVVVITAFARDKVGNISAGKTTSIQMTGAQYITMLTKVIKEKVLKTVVYDKVKEC